MIAISLWQPWASAIAVGLKTIETRSWPARCIGHRIAIHAAKRNTREQREWWMMNVKNCGEIHEMNAHAFAQHGIRDWSDLPLGEIVCTADLTAVKTAKELIETRAVRDGGLEFMWGNYLATDPDNGRPRYGWLLKNVERWQSRALVIGRQGFFIYDTATGETVSCGPNPVADQSA